MTRPNDRKPQSNAPEPFDERFGELLCAYLDDELTTAQRAEVEARLESDATARAQLEALTAAADALRNLSRGSAPASILEDLTAQSERAEILGKPEESVTLARHRRGPFRSTMALAAMLMVAVSASLYVSLKSRQDSAINRRLDSDGQELVTKSSPAGEPKLATRDNSKNRGRELFEKSNEDFHFDEMTDDLKKKEASLAIDENEAAVEATTEFGQQAMGNAASTISGDGLEGSPPQEVRRALDSDRLASAKPMSDQSEIETDSVKGKDADKSIDTLGADVATADDVHPHSEFKKSVAAPTPEMAATASPESPSKRLVKLDAEMTFEQKLIAGADAATVANHPFPNEPLQLSVSFENDEEQAEGEKQLQAFLGRNGFQPIVLESQDNGRPPRQMVRADAEEAADPQDSALEHEAFYVGQEAQNYIGSANSRQYLVRLKSDRLGEVVNDLSTIGAEEVQIRVGNVRSQNSEQLWQLASQAAGQSFELPPTGRAQNSRLPRAELKEQKVPGDSKQQANEPETTRWIQALQAYGLLPSDTPDESSSAGKRASDRGGLGDHGGDGATDATTNGTPIDSAMAGVPILEEETHTQQTLLTLVIELINDQAPGKKEQPTKVKQ
jgi:hypothetical protein